MSSRNWKNLCCCLQVRHELDRIQQRFPFAVQLQTEKDIENWNAGKIKLLLAHPASAGHGLNFNMVARAYLVHLPDLEEYLQANAGS